MDTDQQVTADKLCSAEKTWGNANKDKFKIASSPSRGDTAFIPEQRQPFSQDQIQTLFEAFVTVGDSWDPRERAALTAALAYSLCSGVRLDEWTGNMLLRANFIWTDKKGTPIPPNQKPSEGDILEVMSPASKTDPLDLEWGAKKQYYRLEFDNPFNFPMLWLRYENMCPCIPSLRSAWAAFSPFGNKFAFSRQTAVTRLQELTASWSEEVYSSKSKFGYINILESKKSRWSSQLKRAAKSLLFKDVGNHFPRYLTD